MNDQEKIWNKIKNAAERQDPNDFKAMEKVWSRLENKLDHKVLAQQSNTWKKIAVAASVLLVATLGAVLLSESYHIETPKNQVVVLDSTNLKTSKPDISTAVTEIAQPNPAIKTNASAVLKKQLEQQVTVAENSVPSVSEENHKEIVPLPAAIAADEKIGESKSDNSSRFMRSKAFSAKSVVRNEADAANDGNFQSDKSAIANTVAKKDAPLMVLDGEAITGEKAKEAKLNPDIHDIVVLTEPLYIINGHYYSEQELFGPNPTSPYAPLNQQEIETISILQGEKATATYGTKGEKGVVIITTKNRKPAERVIKAPAGKSADQGR